VALVLVVGHASDPVQTEHVHAAPAEQATATPTAPGSYLRTFDEYENDAPLDVGPSSILDVTVHSRDNNTWPATGGLEPMAAEHGAMCEAPPAVHALTGSYDDAVFICKDHIMTAIKAGGYGAIYLTPNQMADFSAGEAVVKFDLSTFRDSSRDWADLWISPFSEQVAVPYESSTPDLLGPPKHAIHVKMEGGTHGTPTGPVSGTPFGVYVVNNFTTTRLDTNAFSYENYLIPSMATRTTFELHLSKTHIKFGMPQYNAWWIDSAIPDLGWDRGVVQFGHHSYNPQKECQEGPDPYLHPGDPGCRAGTWHWDNLSISPSVPYTLIPATNRVADATTPTYTFPAAAPADSYLLVHGNAETAELSLDGGTTWASFPVQQHDTSLEGPAWGHARSFWAAIPAGTTSVQVRGHPSTGAPLGPFVHASIVSLNARPIPTPAPPTNTPVPPTSTPVPPTPAPPTSTLALPTATPLPPTSTAVPPTATAMPATATAVPSAVPIACQVQVILNGTPGPLRECR
jgi:hypothetical protein